MKRVEIGPPWTTVSTTKAVIRGRIQAGESLMKKANTATK
jgi:hypothetical protein